VTIADLQGQLRSFVAERDWEQFHSPKNLVMALTAEVGELTEIFQWLTPEQSLDVMSDPAAATHVADELADVMAYLLRLADVLQVDLAESLLSKITKNAVKYPTDLVRGTAMKYSNLPGREKT
jgi:NTP pyrophosphatase (non-canonical NTP hydrolase)